MTSERIGDSSFARSVTGIGPNGLIGAASPNAASGATTISRHASAMIVPAEYALGLIHATVLAGASLRTR